MLAFRIREVFPDTRITEVHPKVLLRTLGFDDTSFIERFTISVNWSNQHERDAAIGAVCAREGFEVTLSWFLYRGHARGKVLSRKYPFPSRRTTVAHAQRIDENLVELAENFTHCMELLYFDFIF